MSKVGNVTFHTKDYAEGVIRTRTMKLNIRLERNKDRQSDKHPEYKVTELLPDGEVANIGGGWNEESKKGNPYISLNLDDPSFPMPLHVKLFAESENEYDVVWNRPREKAA